MTWPIQVEPGTGTGDGPGGGGPIIIHPPTNGDGGPPIFPPVSGGPVTVIVPGHPTVVVDPRTGQQLPSNTPTATTVTVNPTTGAQTVTPTVQPGENGIVDLLQTQFFGIPVWLIGLGVLIVATGKK